MVRIGAILQSIKRSNKLDSHMPIPFRALKFGALSHSDSPVAYGKSRVSGSSKMSYIMSSKAGCMPGRADIFIPNSLTKPGIGLSLHNNQIISSFKQEKCSELHLPIGPRSSEICPYGFTFDKYHPYDDETLTIAIKASYRQIYGNFHPMESEVPIDLERRLRNGDLTIREFIRGLAKSTFYKSHYFNKVNQQRAIELNYKHLLGRAPNSQRELIQQVELLFNEGFEAHIDSIIDSAEYTEVFGEHIIPYSRCWDSPCGMTTSSFYKMAALSRSFATSDNAIHANSPISKDISGTSQLLKSLAKGSVLNIIFPEHSTKQLYASSIPAKI